jgi:hypothetical protein
MSQKHRRALVSQVGYYPSLQWLPLDKQDRISSPPATILSGHLLAHRSAGEEIRLPKPCSLYGDRCLRRPVAVGR